MAETEKLSRTFEKFRKAFTKYGEIVKSDKLYKFLNEDFLVEIATKRFEYVFESMWKVLKEYLRLEGIDCASPLKCLREAFKNGLIDIKHEKIFIDIVRKRNLIVHIYDEKVAKEICRFIKSKKVYSAIESVYNKFKSEIK
ncbi:MAG: nucleotidyltransferase substrate binding protein [Elusimicrobia bacterium]|nr:nucleotidyltransferase substrate binding protein [Elusimicrobiota bacterium]